jgi:hypothetical protein
MDSVTITLSHHAIQRFHERVRPALDRDSAADELARIALAGRVLGEAPAWHAASAAQEAPLYLVLGDVVLPLKPTGRDAGYVATTCLARGSWSDASRARRNRRRSCRAADPGRRPPQKMAA